MFCMNCGSEIQDGAKFCLNCGSPVGGQVSQIQSSESPSDDEGMACPKCGGHNVQVQMVEQGQKTKRKGIGLGGHINNTARGLTAIGTFGLSNLVWKKSEGVNQTKTNNKAMGICQSCGYSWKI